MDKFLGYFPLVQVDERRDCVLWGEGEVIPIFIIRIPLVLLGCFYADLILCVVVYHLSKMSKVIG